jgi:hypothetical protein
MTAVVILLHCINQQTQLGITYYPDVKKSLIYQLLQENNMTPSRHVFTLCDSCWDDDHDTSRRTGGFLIFHQGGLVDHSSNMSKPVAMISAEVEYYEGCMD